jgi:hypothetical protein
MTQTMTQTRWLSRYRIDSLAALVAIPILIKEGRLAWQGHPIPSGLCRGRSLRLCQRRARLEGRHIGRYPLELDRDAILCDHRRGLSLRQIAKAHRISRATAHRVIRAQQPTKTLSHKGSEN